MIFKLDKKMNRLFIMAGIVTMLAQATTAQAVTDNEGTYLIKYGDMNQWGWF